MIVKTMEWLSERASEAVLYIGEGDAQCAAFCQPCGFKVGADLREPLVAVSVNEMHKVPLTINDRVSRIGDSLAHLIVATVVDHHIGIVTVDGVTIDVDNALPGDIENGDRVSFKVNRLDVIEVA